jgi:ubiquitin-protein ligase
LKKERICGETMNGIAHMRLQQERKAWRKDHPPGFYARPQTKSDGGTNFFRYKLSLHHQMRNENLTQN